MRRLRAGLVTPHPGGAGATLGVTTNPREELADDPGKVPDESAARRRKKNAAMERRKACLLRKGGAAFREDADSGRMRLAALHLPLV